MGYEARTGKRVASRYPGGRWDLLGWMAGMGLWILLPRPQESFVTAPLFCDVGSEFSGTQHTSQGPLPKVAMSFRLQLMDAHFLSEKTEM